MGQILESQQNECRHLRNEVGSVLDDISEVRRDIKTRVQTTNVNFDVVHDEIDDMQHATDVSVVDASEAEDTQYDLTQRLVQQLERVEMWIVSQSGVVRELQAELLEVRRALDELRARESANRRVPAEIDDMQCLGGRIVAHLGAHQASVSSDVMHPLGKILEVGNSIGHPVRARMFCSAAGGCEDRKSRTEQATAAAEAQLGGFRRFRIRSASDSSEIPDGWRDEPTGDATMHIGLCVQGVAGVLSLSSRRCASAAQTEISAPPNAFVALEFAALGRGGGDVERVQRAEVLLEIGRDLARRHGGHDARSERRRHGDSGGCRIARCAYAPGARAQGRGRSHPGQRHRRRQAGGCDEADARESAVAPTAPLLQAMPPPPPQNRRARSSSSGASMSRCSRSSSSRTSSSRTRSCRRRGTARRPRALTPPPGVFTEAPFAVRPARPLSPLRIYAYRMSATPRMAKDPEAREDRRALGSKTEAEASPALAPSPSA